MIFYCLGENHIFVLWSSMWLVQKPVHITTPIGRGELDLVHPTSNQTPILEGPRSFVIIGPGYHLKKENDILLSL